MPSARTPDERDTDLADVIRQIREILSDDGSNSSKEEKPKNRPETPTPEAEHHKAAESQEPSLPAPGNERANLIRLIILADQVFGDFNKRVQWLNEPIFNGMSVLQLAGNARLAAQFEEALRQILKDDAVDGG